MNDGKEEVWLASADWMDRNFFRRVEVAFPIEDKTLRARAIEESLGFYLADNTQAWVLDGDGTYTRLKPDDGPALSAQSALLKKLAEHS